MRDLVIKGLIVVGAVCVLAQLSGAATYTGSLSVADGGLTGTGSWGAGPSMISWTVSNDSGPWTYTYKLEVPKKDISHFIIEVSPDFTKSDFSNVSSSVDLSSTKVGEFKAGSSNPYLPDLFRGIKFDLKEDATSVEVSFQSDCSPVWGDFYAKDGKEKVANSKNSSGTKVSVAIWNTGFTSSDSDPTSPLASGSVGYHLLVPDTKGGNGGFVIPEPLTLIALGMSVIGAGAAARKSIRRA
ncbi:MAG TPA: hypothetical protein VM098_02840 [Phycisphaerae bacterium]|nr:hypothetical protein [Phycisphaerae bacterium]